MPTANEPEIEFGEVSAKSQYCALTEEELKQLALDTIHGQVFGSWMLPDHDQHLMGSIFMVIMFLDDIERKKLIRDNIVHMYGNLKDSMPRSINGYPMFTNVRMLNAADSLRLRDKITQIQTVLEDL